MAEEIINLATFQFDVDKLNQNVDKLTDTIFKLTKEQQSYANSSKEAQKQINSELKLQSSLIAAGQQQGAEYQKSISIVKELTKVQNDNYKAQVNVGNQLSRVKTELTATNKELQAYMNNEAKQNNLSTQASSALLKQIQNINQARASNTELLRVRNQLNPAIEIEARLIDDLNAKMDANNKFIKDNSSAYEKQKIGIGDYARGITEAAQALGFQSTELRNVKAVMAQLQGPIDTLKKGFAEGTDQIKNSAKETEGLSATQKGFAIASNIATGAARIFTLALAATGIGLIISAVALLIGYFKTFDPVVDAIEQGMAALGAAVRVVQQAFAALLSGDFSGFDNLTGKMAEAAKAAATLKAAQQDLADAQRAQSVINKKQEGEIDRLILQSKDRSKTEQERIDLLNKAEKINQENFKENTKLSEQQTAQAIEASRIAGNLSEKEVENLKKVGLAYAIKLMNTGKITEDEVKLIEDAENAKLDIYNRSTSEQEKIVNKRNAQIEKQEEEAKKAAEEAKKRQEKAIEDAKKRADAAIKAMQVELDFYLESQGYRKKSMSEQLEIDKETMRQSLAINKAEYDAKKITKREYELANLEIQHEFAAKQVEATIANADIEFELFKLNNQRKLDENKFFSDELYQQELERLNKVAEAQAAQQTLLFENGKINAQEYGLAIAQIDAEQLAANDAVKLEREQAENDKKAADIEIQAQIDAEAFDTSLALQMERYNQQYALEKEAAIKAGADMVAFDQAQALKKKEIEQTVQNNKLELASQTLGNLATLLGKESAAGKAAAIAQTTIDTYKAAQSAYSAMAGIPIVGPVLGAIAAGAAVVTGIANVKKITSVKEPKTPSPGYARGVIGLQGAGSGTSDSLAANLSAGESVLTAEATNKFPNLLSKINMAGGGVGLNGMTASENSLLQNDISNSASSSAMVEAMANAVYIAAKEGTQKGSTDGLTNLSDNRQIMADAKF